MENYKSNQLIFSYDFPTFEKAFQKLNSFGFGELKEIASSNFILLSETSLLPIENKYFFSETINSCYRYSIEIYSENYILKVFKTHKHGMITGAITGNLEMFKKYFTDTEKMREFSLSMAIHYNQWNITEYLLDNYILKLNPMWNAISGNKVEIIIKLLDRKFELPNDWLTYCIYSDSLKSTKILLESSNFKYEPTDLKWFTKELKKDTETANYVRNIIFKS